MCDGAGGVRCGTIALASARLKTPRDALSPAKQIVRLFFTMHRSHHLHHRVLLTLMQITTSTVDFGPSQLETAVQDSLVVAEVGIASLARHVARPGVDGRNLFAFYRLDELCLPLETSHAGLSGVASRPVGCSAPIAAITFGIPLLEFHLVKDSATFICTALQRAFLPMPAERPEYGQ